MAISGQTQAEADACIPYFLGTKDASGNVIAPEAEESYEFIGDPDQQIRRYISDSGWLKLAAVKLSNTNSLLGFIFPITTAGFFDFRWKTLKHGAQQPGVLCVTKERNVLFRWASIPNFFWNHGGALHRPGAQQVWEMTKLGLNGNVTEFNEWTIGRFMEPLVRWTIMIPVILPLFWCALGGNWSVDDGGYGGASKKEKNIVALRNILVSVTISYSLLWFLAPALSAGFPNAISTYYTEWSWKMFALHTLMIMYVIGRCTFPARNHINPKHPTNPYRVKIT